MTGKLIGTPIIFGDEALKRTLTDLPIGVTRWRIKHRGGAVCVRVPYLYLHYADGRTEQWIMGPVGEDKMKPVIMQGYNARGRV